MERQATTQSAEAPIQLFLRAADNSESENLLSLLIREHVEPIIVGIIKHKLRVSLNNSEGSSRNQDALEIAGDVRATILAEMQALKAGASARSISDFHNFVAIKTFSACADYFRAKNPQRRRLKDLLRYHLKQNPTFALWEGEEGRWLCGLQIWRDREPNSSRPERLQQSPADPLSLFNALKSVSAVGVSPLSPAELLTVLFETIGHPIEFKHLVTIVADVWGVKDQPNESFDQNGKAVASLIDSSTRVDALLEQRLYLQRLWTEVAELPPLQRSALLLNLRDAQGGSVIAFIPHLGIAGKTEIAEMLSMSAEQFSELWNELPLDDASISRLLGVTRQQVINLRKTARERLSRRMRAIEKTGDGNKSERRTV